MKNLAHSASLHSNVKIAPSNPGIKHLTGEIYKPIPPSDPSDWNRTALMAVEDGGAGLALCLYWWAREDEIEPCVIFISGGTANIFADVEEFIDYLADGTFPAEGDKILSNLEIERGTLSD